MALVVVSIEYADYSTISFKRIQPRAGEPSWITEQNSAASPPILFQGNSQAVITSLHSGAGALWMQQFERAALLGHQLYKGHVLLCTESDTLTCALFFLHLLQGRSDFWQEDCENGNKHKPSMHRATSALRLISSSPTSDLALALMAHRWDRTATKLADLLQAALAKPVVKAECPAYLALPPLPAQ